MYTRNVLYYPYKNVSSFFSRVMHSLIYKEKIPHQFLGNINLGES